MVRLLCRASVLTTSQIYDLNNVPLVSGVSLIKWNLPHSLHTEHRGRTPKCPIANHRVEYNHSKIIPVRIGIDRNNNLVECPVEFEVLQEFSIPTSSGGTSGFRDEKITLGTVRINLSEYVEESEAILRDGTGPGLLGRGSFSTSVASEKYGHARKRSSLSGISGTSGAGEDTSLRSTRTGETDERPVTADSDVEEGVVRRHLMQDSKINSTLKIGVLMIQIDGDRNYVAPALKTAPVFGGIAGLMTGDPTVDPAGEPSAETFGGGGPVPSSLTGKARENAAELQDMYRRSLAASWACQPGEMAADECVEDIFGGGDGFKGATKRGGGLLQPGAEHQTRAHTRVATHSSQGSHQSGGSSSSAGGGHASALDESASPVSGEDERSDAMGTLRPRDLARLRGRFHLLGPHSDRSSTPTNTKDPAHESSRGIGLGHGPTRENPHRGISFWSPQQQLPPQRDFSRDRERDPPSAEEPRHTPESLDSLSTGTGAAGSDGYHRSHETFRSVRELDEYDVRDDLVAWKITA